jgi:hypothetical protein
MATPEKQPGLSFFLETARRQGLSTILFAPEGKQFAVSNFVAALQIAWSIDWII